ncbi:MAG: DUF3868 domain-containing protein [Muribaculum sp.]|nr:DUF3868 domain-containing protein [Muribaculum sp.]
MKKLLLAICAAACLWTPARALNADLLDGSVSLRNVKVERSQSRLILNMDIDASALKQGGSSETVLTPVLTGEDGRTFRFPQVVISGRNRYYYRLRNYPSDSDVMLYRSAKGLDVPYQSVTGYEPWMETAELSVEYGQSDCGCDAPLTPFPLMRLDYRPRVFAPRYVFVTPEAEAVKVRNLKGSAYIDFPVNRTELYPDYRRNPEELSVIRKTIEVVRNDSDVTITSFAIKGFASPEGPYENNVRLAKGRTATLEDYVQKLYSFDPSIMHTSYEPEDWEGLRRYVETSDLADRDAILEIISDTVLQPDAREWRLKSRYPEQYAFLLKEVYPGLRHSDYTIDYIVRTYTSVDEIRRVMSTAPQNLSLNELFVLAQSYEPGSPDYLEVFETAVRMYPADPVANLNAANISLQRGELDKAAGYLAKAGDSPQATYARGLLEAFRGDYAKALPLLEKASRSGISEATEAISQINDIIEYNKNNN